MKTELAELAARAQVLARLVLPTETYLHSQRLAMKPGLDGYQQALRWLHDVVEDTKVTEADLYVLGFGKALVDSVMVLTRRDDETYAEYIARVKASGDSDAIGAKLDDLDDNTTRPTKRASLQKRYERAKEVLRA